MPVAGIVLYYVVFIQGMFSYIKIWWMILTVTLEIQGGKRSNEGERESAASSSAVFSTCFGTEQTCWAPRATTFKPGGASKKNKLTINYVLQNEPTLFLYFFLFLSLYLLLSCQTDMMDWVISVPQKHERLSGAFWCSTARISFAMLWWSTLNPDESTWPLNTLHLRLNVPLLLLIKTYDSLSPFL